MTTVTQTLAANPVISTIPVAAAQVGIDLIRDFHTRRDQTDVAENEAFAEFSKGSRERKAQLLGFGFCNAQSLLKLGGAVLNEMARDCGLKEVDPDHRNQLLSLIAKLQYGSVVKSENGKRKRWVVKGRRDQRAAYVYRWLLNNTDQWSDVGDVPALILSKTIDTILAEDRKKHEPKGADEKRAQARKLVLDTPGKRVVVVKGSTQANSGDRNGFALALVKFVADGEVDVLEVLPGKSANLVSVRDSYCQARVAVSAPSV